MELMKWSPQVDGLDGLNVLVMVVVQVGFKHPQDVRP